MSTSTVIAQNSAEADPWAETATTSNVDATLNDTLQEHQSEQANLTDLKRTAEAEVAALAAEEKRLADLDAALKKRISEAEALEGSPR